MTMPIEDQKFMCLFGLRSWAEGVVVQVERINEAIAHFPEASFPGSKFRFDRERHVFLISASQLMRHIKWSKRIGYPDADVFSEIERHAQLVKDMRDFNEHVIEYFEGDGRRQDDWKRLLEKYNADPSSTQGTMIGGVLDWNVVAVDARTLLTRLPSIKQFWAAR